MKIYDSDGNVILDVEVDDTSYRYRAIMGEDALTLKFSLAEHVEIPIGAWTEWQGQIYTLVQPEALTMHHTRYFEYTVTMESPQARAKIWKFRNTVDRRLKFSLTATPREHLQMFVDNMNERDYGWEIGECIENDEVCISYDHAYCYDALGQMAEEFDTEFEITGKTVSLHKVEYNKSDPLALSYGKGNGFKPDVGRANYSDTPPVEVLYVQGGSDNIDSSKYGNSDLLLPAANADGTLQTIGYDGEHFEDEEGFNADSARYYQSDADRYSIRRADKEVSDLGAEDSLDCSEIYPKRVGVISAVEEVDADKNFWDIIDEDIPSSLDYNDYQIDGETWTVIFQSGMLSGKEFEISKYTHSERRLELVPQEIDGVTMPNETFAPAVGDKYAVFYCMLPDAYICDNETKSGAEWDMFRKAVQYLFENEEQKYTISGKMDGIWSKKDWENIGGKIVLGGYVSFVDERFQPEATLLRIIGVKDYINRPHSPELELSNCTVAASFGTMLKQIESKEVLIEDNYKKAVTYTKRRFRDAQESMTLLEAAMDALSAGFTESVSPITIQTMMMLVGDESLQFRFVTALVSDTAADLYVTYDSTARQLSVSGPASDGTSYLQHLTLGIDTITTSHSYLEYRAWHLPEYLSGSLDDGDQAYYLYAKVADYAETGWDTQVGEFRLEKEAHAMESEEGWLWLLVGILNSEYQGTRSFISLYGFTEILPGRITTDLIVSADGMTFFDLVNGIISGRITFINSSGETQELSETVTEINEFMTETDKTLEGLTKQIDGKVEAWFQTSDPSEGWTEDERESHVDDMWYDTGSGKLYYYEYDSESGKYVWSPVTDADTVAAYEAASKAQDTADGKRRIFVDTPVPPYDVGDLWYGAGVTTLSSGSDDGGEDDDSGVATAAASTASDDADEVTLKIIVFVPGGVGTKMLLSGATVTVNGTEYVTGSDGAVTVTLPAGTDVEWSIEADGYVTQSGTLAVTESQSLTVTLAGVDGDSSEEGEPYLTLAADTAEFTADGGTVQIGVSHNGVAMSVTWSGSWLNAATAAGNTSVNITAEPNTSILARTGTVTVRITYSDGSILNGTITVTQEEKAPSAVGSDINFGGSESNVFGSSTQRKILACVRAKAEGESFEASDWGENVTYDNTQTVIDGGIVTSGTIQVAGSEDAVLAGMTGNGTDGTSVRFWAGSTFDERESASFRVQQDGTIYASKGIFSGFLRIPFVELTSVYTGTSDNYLLDGKYCNIKIDGGTRRLLLPYDGDNPDNFSGMVLSVFMDYALTRTTPHVLYINSNNGVIYHSDFKNDTETMVRTGLTEIEFDSGGFVQLLNVGDNKWIVLIDTSITTIVND